MKIKLFKDWKMVSEGLLILSIMIYLIFALRLDLLTVVIWPIFFGACYILIQMINRYKRLKAKLNASYMKFLDSRIYLDTCSLEDVLFPIISSVTIGKGSIDMKITSESLRTLTENASERYVEILQLFEEKSIKHPKTNIECSFNWIILVSKIGFPYTNKPKMSSIFFDGYLIQGETIKCNLVFCEFIEVLKSELPPEIRYHIWDRKLNLNDTITLPVFFLDEHTVNDFIFG